VSRSGEGRREPTFEIGNEFAAVEICRVRTRNGERLRITSRRLGSSIDLDALALESLTWQTPETFSRFLTTPFGREDDEAQDRG
jgi:hypothetical protein